MITDFVPPPNRGKFYRFNFMKASHLAEPAKGFPKIGLNNTPQNPKLWKSLEVLLVEIKSTDRGQRGTFHFFSLRELGKVLFEGEFSSINTYAGSTTVYGFCTGLARIEIELFPVDYDESKEESQIDGEDDLVSEVGCAISGESEEESPLLGMADGVEEDDLPPPTMAPEKYRNIGRPTRVIERKFDAPSIASEPETESQDGGEDETRAEHTALAEVETTLDRAPTDNGLKTKDQAKKPAKKITRGLRRIQSKKYSFPPPGTYDGLMIEGGAESLDALSDDIDLGQTPSGIASEPKDNSRTSDVAIASPAQELTRATTDRGDEKSLIPAQGQEVVEQDLDIFLAFGAEAEDFSSSIGPIESGEVDKLEDLSVAQLKRMLSALEGISCTSLELIERIRRVLG